MFSIFLIASKKNSQQERCPNFGIQIQKTEFLIPTIRIFFPPVNAVNVQICKKY